MSASTQAPRSELQGTQNCSEDHGIINEAPPPITRLSFCLADAIPSRLTDTCFPQCEGAQSYFVSVWQRAVNCSPANPRAHLGDDAFAPTSRICRLTHTVDHTGLELRECCLWIEPWDLHTPGMCSILSSAAADTGHRFFFLNKIFCDS